MHWLYIGIFAYCSLSLVIFIITPSTRVRSHVSPHLPVKITNVARSSCVSMCKNPDKLFRKESHTKEEPLEEWKVAFPLDPSHDCQL
ncbi:unnamed protein product [Periconia digitata]|uniref:Uncharacterized protein n=1 Tax=Periconia digitata TaxID=1303443 RepID=A0A9W4UML7_9PLEO|nr:unnamed protein product [Periconia digitata]